MAAVGSKSALEMPLLETEAPSSPSNSSGSSVGSADSPISTSASSSSSSSSEGGATSWWGWAVSGISAAGSAVKSTAKAINEFVHSPAGSTVGTVASAGGVAYSLYNGDWGGIICSSGVLGYFAQTSCEHLKDAENPTVRKVHEIGGKVKRHTAFEVWIATGVINACDWGAEPAAIVNMVMAGMYAKDKMVEWSNRVRNKTIEMDGDLELGESSQEAVDIRSVLEIVRDNKGVVCLGVLGSGLLFSGISSVKDSDRTFTWETITAEYGTKILAGIFGKFLEQYLFEMREANPDSKAWKWTHRILSLHGPMIGGSAHLYQGAASNGKALLAMIPFGLAVGGNQSRCWREFKERESLPLVERTKPSVSERVAQVVFTIAPIAVGSYIFATTSYDDVVTSLADVGGELTAAPIAYHIAKACEPTLEDSHSTQRMKRKPNFVLGHWPTGPASELIYWRTVYHTFYSQLTPTQRIVVEVAGTTYGSMLYGLHRRALNSEDPKVTKQSHVRVDLLSKTITDIV